MRQGKLEIVCRQGIVVRVESAGLEEEEDTWEPPGHILNEALQFLKLQKMKLAHGVTPLLKKKTGSFVCKKMFSSWFERLRKG